MRLGFLADFLSRTVLVGFLTGVGIQVAMGQVAGMLGVSDGTGGTLEKFWNTIENIPGHERRDAARLARGARRDSRRGST